MFIVWGTTHSEKTRGIVADRCIHCSKVTTLRLSQIYRKRHVYFIPLGAGELAATTLTCTGCGGKASCAPQTFPIVLTEYDATSLPLSKVLEQTNPRLYEAVDYRMRLEQQVRTQPQAGTEAVAQLALLRLAELENAGPRGNELRARLSQWTTLDAPARTRLLAEIDQLERQLHHLNALRSFVRQTGQQFKPDVDGCLGFVALIGTLVLGIVLLAKFVDDGGLVCGGIVALLPLSVLVSLLVHRTLRRYAHKRFFRKVLLPEADRRGLDMNELVTTIASITLPHDEQSELGLRGMVKALPVLKEVLTEEGRSVTESAEG